MKEIKIGEVVYQRTKYSDLSGQTAVAWSDSHGSKIEAKPYGVVIQGKFEINSIMELNDFARLMDSAWRDHLTLKPKLVNSLSGH